MGQAGQVGQVGQVVVVEMTVLGRCEKMFEKMAHWQGRMSQRGGELSGGSSE